MYTPYANILRSTFTNKHSLTGARGHACRFSLTQLRGTRGPTGGTNFGAFGSANCGVFFPCLATGCPVPGLSSCMATGCPVPGTCILTTRVAPYVTTTADVEGYHFGSTNPSVSDIVCRKYDTSSSRITSSGAPWMRRPVLMSVFQCLSTRGNPCSWAFTRAFVSLS